MVLNGIGKHLLEDIPEEYLLVGITDPISIPNLKGVIHDLK